MSDPARKRRNAGLPHWRQHPRHVHAPPLSSSDGKGGCTAYSDLDGRLQSVSSASAAPELSSHQNVDATVTSWTNHMLFPGSQSGFFALDLSTPELAPSSQLGSLSSLPPLNLEYDVHSGLGETAPAATVPLTAGHPWPNVTGLTEETCSQRLLARSMSFRTSLWKPSGGTSLYINWMGAQIRRPCPGLQPQMLLGLGNEVCCALVSLGLAAYLPILQTSTR